MIQVKLELVMVRFLVNPPLRRGAKHSLCMSHERTSIARATDLVETRCVCGARPQTFSGMRQGTAQLITLGQMLPEIT